jgi:hypothetical protein
MAVRTTNAKAALIAGGHIRLAKKKTKAAGIATTTPTTGNISADSASLASGFAAKVAPGKGMRLKKPKAKINLVVKGRISPPFILAALDQPVSHLHKRGHVKNAIDALSNSGIMFNVHHCAYRPAV